MSGWPTPTYSMTGNFCLMGNQENHARLAAVVVPEAE